MAGSEPKPSLTKVLKMQGANIVQQAQLHVLTTKVIRVKQILEAVSREPEFPEADDAVVGSVVEALRVLGLDRNAIREMRDTWEYPDEEIQAVITRAVDEITAILLRPKP